MQKVGKSEHRIHKREEETDLSFTYPKHVSFRCERCALCCGDTENKPRRILLLRNEAEHISEKTSMSICEFAEKTGGVEPYAYVTKKSQDGRCVFLVGKSCSIYEMRPLICRFYPFELRNLGRGKYSFTYTNECPAIGKGRCLERRFFESLFRIFVASMRKDSVTERDSFSE